MSSSQAHDPFELDLGLRTGIPASNPVQYVAPTSEDTLPRAGSQHTGESSQDPTFGEQTQSETTLDIPTQVLSREPSFEPQEPPSRSSAPSPAPTEIIPLDLTQEEIVEEIQKTGIKVRDFAHEAVPIPQRAVELFDPLQAWNTYETVISHPTMMRPCLPGKITRRLLDIGWLKREDEEERWSNKDREALEAYDKRPHYPWRAYNLPKPKREVLAKTWRMRFQDITAEQMLATISRPFSRFRAPFEFGGNIEKKRSATADQDVQGGEVSPRTKKRRLEQKDAASLAPMLSQPPVLINGRPPQQYPAGNPADMQKPSPSFQPTSTRTLQRVSS
ncbi:uncharacterized protein F5147DRAFT_727900 [Suillus discolor]|uniref:Uncharacterized protein n=1 Tax=Suillus discolor TaxID=1912936 RepID=A0A9P7ERU0_9AGAM|nr:uncharacterized protein F5147DRAFT_727900 [Suillus discolor]KAG2087367.1 hypothetical protein F5147DRAFT_727900 [Suillus discolor]